ncbi:MAG: hypothetical protein HXY50_02900 [Ignavibacteriaceae bacterium]|nr:hypothetical protein [Ignavibacteriaceae bacterium]
MSCSKTKILAAAFFFLILSFKNAAQTTDTTYKVNAIFGLGYSYFLTSLSELDGLNPHSFNSTIKIMWQPEHLLRVGIESGYLSFYSYKQTGFTSEYGTTDVKSSLAAVPIILAFAMELFDRIEVSSGVGIYFLFSEIDSYNNNVSSSVFSNGYYASLSYFHPLYRDISIGGELKYYYISKIEDADLSLQLTLKYSFLEY